jgi:glutamate dehydrogenase
MAITARGAWEAVKRHFREIDHDIQSLPFTVAGIGDMSGDVFGNGMLLSRKTRLLAAFDHRDIFIDPDPDLEKSFAERKRLFALPRSSWQDYDKALISKGGGVFSRTLKAIPLAPEARAAIRLDKREATPAEVMHAILRAPVDLLWFGGIGTYIRASDETDEQVGDRANDAIRVTSAQLRCKAIGEGANLGATQKGRIEAARRGIRLNTDAIDNSAGVNTSDLEVNIKIALAKPEADGRIAGAERKALLAAMTDEVAGLVLRNNYLQSLALSLAAQRGVDDVAYVRKLMQRLEREGRLDRAVEFLPEDAQLAERERRGEGLTRPELAVLLAYAKLSLHDMLLASRVPDDPYLSGELQRYFPAPVRERFPDAVAEHRLRREIVATQLANAIVNRGGPTIVERVAARTGAGATEIAAAYALARDGFGLLDINLAIDRLDARIAGKTQLALYGLVQDALIGALTWFARRIGEATDLSPIAERYRGGIAEIRTLLAALLPEAERTARSKQIAGLTESGVPLDLAEAITDLDALTAAPDVVDIAGKLKRPIRDVAAAHYALRGHFRLDQVTAQARAVPVADDYERLARDRAIDAIAEAHRRATTDVLNHHRAGDNAAALWLKANDAKVTRIRSELDAMAASGMSLAKVVVAASLVGELVTS